MRGKAKRYGISAVVRVDESIKFCSYRKTPEMKPCNFQEWPEQANMMSETEEIVT